MQNRALLRSAPSTIIKHLAYIRQMSDKPSQSFDLLGVKPIAESVNKLTSAAVDGSAAFLSRICLPAAEEFGLLLRDRVHAWRAARIAALTAKAENQLAQIEGSETLHAHPRIVAEILEEGSWIEDPVVQDYWAGLLSSACTASGDDDSNLIFVSLLSELTKLQARVVDYACRNADKYVTAESLIQARPLQLSPVDLSEISQESDIQRLDRELDHLRELGLIHEGFVPHRIEVDITPTALALHLFVRCQGSRASPKDYFNLPMPGTPTVAADKVHSGNEH